MRIWHPWRWLRDYYPDMSVRHEPLPGEQMGEVDGTVIRIRAGLTQAERRCTLAHELVHVERRGVEHPNPIVEETIVELAAARLLISHQQLVDAFRWLRHPDVAELAEHLWVDRQTVMTRMEHLDAIEVAQIDHACDGDWSWTGAA